MKVYELVVIWDTGEKEVYSYSTEEEAQIALKELQLVSGKHISGMRIRKGVELMNKDNCNKVCYNINTGYPEYDEFVCSNCGIQIRGWYSIEYDQNNDIVFNDYEFKYCPNCGAKIKRIE